MGGSGVFGSDDDDDDGGGVTYQSHHTKPHCTHQNSPVAYTIDGQEAPAAAAAASEEGGACALLVYFHLYTCMFLLLWRE